ncbi:KIR protein [Plasmodium coatneyi]|uniref:KIR protein n=1 Tax=Plasmodium coatneyi TaxID=208452 RepID=A0A1B1E6F8_9APIC|nr:KIR protein [Plasmodium coatneyi]ANQ10578.1 KIR protein [Plasmodium coatneyi]
MGAVNDEEIANAWCILSKLNIKGTQCEKLCDFFYFWLGDMLCDKFVRNIQFQDIMQQIYTALNGSSDNCKYQPMHSTVSCSDFKKGKVVFDYYHDYRTIIRELKASEGSCATHCTTKYKNYLDGADNKYKMVKAGSSVNSHDYYDQIVKEIKDNGGSIPPPSQLTCRTVSTEMLVSDEGDNEDGTDLLENGGGGTAGSTATPAIISSVAATIGLPTMTFLLYKYTSVFSFINNFFGNDNSNISSRSSNNIKSRRKRTTIHHDLNSPLSDDDDNSSTLYTTTDDSTTIGDDSTDESSLFGGRLPTSRGRSNNRSGKNISYQRI